MPILPQESRCVTRSARYTAANSLPALQDSKRDLKDLTETLKKNIEKRLLNDKNELDLVEACGTLKDYSTLTDIAKKCSAELFTFQALEVRNFLKAIETVTDTSNINRKRIQKQISCFLHRIHPLLKYNTVDSLVVISKFQKKSCMKTFQMF